MELTNIKVLDDLKCGKISCLEHTKQYIERIEAKNKNINCFLEINQDATKQAKELDEKRKSSKPLGKFFGLCFGLKAVINVRDMNISSSSKVLSNYKGTYNADITNTIIKEDGIILGLLNCDEFACGSTGANSFFNRVENPLSNGKIPGGSSSGSAASVCANFCDISIGTDTGGSIRTPSAFCGVFGIKPTYGLISRYGLNDMCMSLDTIGPISKNIDLCFYCLSVLSGKSENDSTSLSSNYKYEKDINLNLDGKKVGIIKGFSNYIKDKKIKICYEKVLDTLKNEKVLIKEIEIKHINLGVEAYYPIVFTEFFSATRKFDGIKYGEKFEENVKNECLRRRLGGEEISKSEFDSAYYKKALEVKNLLSKEFKLAFKNVDFIIMPTTPNLANSFDKKLTTKEEYYMDIFTVPISLAEIPAGVIPFIFESQNGSKIEKNSIGIQIIADKLCEEKIHSLMKFLDKKREDIEKSI